MPLPILDKQTGIKGRVALSNLTRDEADKILSRVFHKAGRTLRTYGIVVRIEGSGSECILTVFGETDLQTGIGVGLVLAHFDMM